MEQTLVLIERAHQGDKEAREQLVKDNLGLVFTVARRFAGRGTETEDLIQIGSIGLLKAIDHFDTEYDVRFSTYAVPMIVGEIRRYLRDDGMLKVSRTLKETARRAAAARESLWQRLGHEPDFAELSAEIGIPREEIILAMESAASVESLQAPVYQGDGTAVFWEDRLEAGDNSNERVLDHMALKEVLGELSPEEQKVILLRYFQDQTQTNTASILGRTQVQISRMEKRILKKLREAMER